MIFDTDYWNALNRKEKDDVLLNPQQLGYSLGGNPLENLKTGIFTGANTVELTFFGAPGKGQDKQSPEMWGKNERQEMKELARVNEVDVSVHASPNMGSGGAALSGFDGKTFSDAARKKALDEIQRTAEFAADVTGGGPVVVHIDGFPREIFRAGGEKGKFIEYPYEKEKAPVYFVDKRNGQIEAISRETKIPIPKKDEKTGEYQTDEKGNYIIGLKTFAEMEDDFEKNKKELEKEGITNKFNYFYNEHMQGQIQEWTAREQEFTNHAQRYKKNAKLFKEQVESYKELQKSKGPIEAKKLYLHSLSINKELQSAIGGGQGEHEELLKDPVKFLNNNAEFWERETTIAEEGALGYARQKQQQGEKIHSNVEISEYGVQKEADTIARSAIKLRDLTKDKKLKDPLWIAPENWDERFHGSHPNEMREVIQESRKRMVKLLTSPKLKNEVTGELEKNDFCKNGISRTRAEKLAEEHIRATFDIGHLNVWRKYHTGDNKSFDSWVKKNVRDLVKDNIIGHVHLSDNFGYYDEHLELGEGNAPLQDFMKILKEEGYKGKMVVEPGGQRKDQTHRVWTSALKFGQSPIYRIDAASKTWTDIEGSYFGRTHSPSFMVGDYVPSKDWTLWSETPFE
jgi:hypothetical protein